MNMDNPFSSGGIEDPFAQIGGQGQPSPQTMGKPQLPASTNNNTTEGKYHILNMFWLTSPKIYTNAGWLDNEAHFAELSYNLDFNNMRLSFGKMTNESIVNGNIIALNKINRFTSGTIYPASMFEVIAKVPEVKCMEQIINYTGQDWQTKRPTVTFKTTDKNIIANINEACYEFTDIQKEILLYSFKFALNQGFTISGQMISRR